ncbi:nucleotidyl transferase AbiEii/AbiGii toxin family protein [Pectinatus sottacetonis]|uniref:nucleotidyl transferase AbiEii/AbiGii toxin family protein n=1 Tax=Pectinatus sottacetonis TaxID=1002795 RepID=UPI0018C770ED|nr:nucleotidyl transferase AbiEii/AbiGii toxin family protein [Pectinatus sottacetonis]
MENSKKLLNYAINILEEGSVSSNNWSIGGGTILANTYNHRMSKDIDVFLDDVQQLSSLSPRFNNKSEDALDYDEMSQYISLTFPEGKVDFIAGPQITDFPAQKQQFLGREVRLDDPVEIVSKKIYFRGNQVLPRDVFDLAVVYNSDRRQDLIKVAFAMPDKMNTFIDAFTRQMQNSDFEPYSITNHDMLLPGGKSLQGREFSICQQFIQKIQVKLNRPQNLKKSVK